MGDLMLACYEAWTGAWWAACIGGPAWLAGQWLR